MAELFNNFPTSTLAFGITNADTILTVATGDGNKLFPVLTGSDFFRCVLFNKTNGNIEIITVTTRTGDVFNVIARAQEEIGNITPAVAYAFNAGDLIELRPTKGFYDSLAAVSTTDIQFMGYNFGVDSGAADAYIVDLTPNPASYAAPLRIAWIPQNTNTGASTLIEKDLAGTPESIVTYGGAALIAGDIETGKLALAIYDDSDFILMNPRKSLTDDVARQSQANTFTATNTFDDIDVNGGEIDDAVIGGNTPAAITGTTLKADTSLQAAAGVAITAFETTSTGSASKSPTSSAMVAYVAAQIAAGSVIASRTSSTQGHLEFEVSSGVGIMIAWGTDVDATGGTATYEKAFSATPWVVILGAQDFGGSGSSATASLVSSSSTQFSYGSSTATDNIHYIAIGPTTP